MENNVTLSNCLELGSSRSEFQRKVRSRHDGRKSVERFARKEFQQRYPNGSKKYFYRKSVVEKFSPYKLRDGLVLKINEFRDNFRRQKKRTFRQTNRRFVSLVTDLIRMNFHYEHRHDKLERREFHVTTNVVQEFYRVGRPDRLKGKNKNIDLWPIQ